jgi:hypothetical protein
MNENLITTYNYISFLKTYYKPQKCENRQWLLICFQSLICHDFSFEVPELHRSQTRPELLPDFLILLQEMGMAAKSTNFLASIFRVRLPFHAFTYSTINTGSRDNVQNPNQSRNQFLQSVRYQCKARAFRNVDHALHLFDKIPRPMASC